jgi:hypothetical protein
MSLILRSEWRPMSVMIEAAETSAPRAFSVFKARSNSWCAAGVQKNEDERRIPRLDWTRRIGPPDGGKYSGSGWARLSIEWGAETARLVERWVAAPLGDAHSTHRGG